MNTSTLLIQSQQQDNYTMGTGFVIHQDSFGSYVLTCAHVIEEVKVPKIDGFDVEVKSKGSKETLDLALLYVKGLFKTPFELQMRQCETDDVQLIGFSLFSKDKYQGKIRDATILGDKVTLKGISQGTEYAAWQIVTKNKYEIEHGNSGGPLLCQKSGKVIGVMSNNKDGKYGGYAIAIEHLRDIWEDIPPFLFESDDENESPFVGLSAFGIEQSHLFFGREQETQEIIEKLKKEDLIAVVGDSGSGKSSVIKAGVIPQYLNGSLDGEEDSNFYLIDTRPAKNPFNELSYSMSKIAEEFKLEFNDINQIKIAIRSKNSESVLNGLEQIFKKEHSTLLIYIDQFEELFTLCEDEVQKEFIEVLLYLLNNQTSNLRIKIIFTMRRDYYNLISEYEEFFQLTQASKYTLRRMQNEQIKECIEKPLERTFIPKERIRPFTKAVLQDMGDKSSELALLQIALTQTWKHKQDYENNLLRTYHEIGEVSGALAKLAQDTWSILDPIEQRILKYIFIRIIQPGETGGVTRRLADKEEFSEDAWHLAQKLSSALDSNGNIASEKNARLGRLLKIKGKDGKVVELTHEALVGQWPMYQRWLKEVNKNHLKRIHDRVIEKTKSYQLNQKKKFLLMGYELEESMKLLEDGYRDYLSADEIAYIEKSCSQEKRSKLKKRILLLGLVVLTATSIYFGIYAKGKRDDAQKQERIANKATLKATRVLRDSNIEKGLIYRDELNQPIKAKLLFAKSVASSTTEAEKKTSKILYNTINNGMKLDSVMQHKRIVWDASFSKNGKYILSCSSDKKAKLWEKKSGKLLYSFPHKGIVWGAVFSPDEKQILTWGADNQVKLWNVSDGTPIFSPLIHKDVWKAKFSKDDKHILTWSENVTKIWDKENGKLVETLTHKNIFKSVSSSEDEKHILCKVKDTKRVIALATRDNNRTLSRFEHDNDISGAKFSSDEKYIFTWDSNGTFKIWDNKEKYRLLYERKHDKNIKGLKFSNNHKELLTWGGDKELDKGTVKLWKVTIYGLTHVATFNHDGWVNGAEFTNNGQNILSWSKDRTVRLWNKSSRKELFLLRHNSSVRRAKLNVNENEILTYSDDGLIRLWKRELKRKLLVLENQKKINGLLFTKDEKKMLFWGKQDYMVRIRDKSNNVKIFNHEGEVYGAKFSKNEKNILSWGSNHQAILWDRETKKKIFDINHTSTVIGAEFDIDSKKIFSWSKDGTVKLSNNSEKVLLDLQDKKELLGLVFSQNQQMILTWSKDNVVRLWKREKGIIREICTVKHQYYISGAKFSSDEKQIISWGKIQKYPFNGVIRIWDINKNNLLKDINYSTVVYGLMFNKERTKVLSWHKDGSVELRDIKSNKEILIYKHSNWVRGAIFSEDEQRILSWSEDKYLKLWDVESKKELLTIKHKFPVIEAKFIHDGREIVSWSYNGEVKFYNLYRDRKLNKKDYLLEAELENGVRLTDVGEIKPLSFKEWKERETAYKKIIKKSQKKDKK